MKCCQHCKFTNTKSGLFCIDYNCVCHRNSPKWADMYACQRIQAVTNCRWITRTGSVTKLGEKIAKTEWVNLSDAARNVLIAHGYSN